MRPVLQRGFWHEHLSHPCGDVWQWFRFLELMVTLQLRHCAGGGQDMDSHACLSAVSPENSPTASPRKSELVQCERCARTGCC